MSGAKLRPCRPLLRERAVKPSLAVAVSPPLMQTTQATLPVSEALFRIKWLKQDFEFLEALAASEPAYYDHMLLKAKTGLATATGAPAAVKANWADASSSDNHMGSLASAKSSRRRGPRRGPLPSLGVGRASTGSEASLFA